MGLGIEDSHFARNVIYRSNWSKSSGYGGTQTPLGHLLPLNTAMIGRGLNGSLGFGCLGVGDRGQSGVEVGEKGGDAQASHHQGIILRQRFSFDQFLRKTFAAEWSSTHGHPPIPEDCEVQC